MSKYAYWTITIDDYIEIYEMAKKNGKKAGDSMEEEFIEYFKSKKGDIQLLGTGDKDIDLLTGDMREQGKKVLNLDEIRRRKNRNK